MPLNHDHPVKEQRRRKNDRSQDCHPTTMDRRAERAARPRKRAHPAGRRAGPHSTRVALGADRDGLHLPDRGGPPQPGAALRGAIATRHLQLHVRPGLRGRVPGLLFHRRQLQWGARAPQGPGRHHDLRLTRPAGQAHCLPQTDGVELQLGVQLRERLQLRLRALSDHGDGRHLVRGRAAPGPCPPGRRVRDRRGQLHVGAPRAERVHQVRMGTCTSLTPPRPGGWSP